MAEEMTIRGTQAEVKIRNPWAAALLPIITLGIYHLVWWYRVNRELRDYGEAKGIDLGQNPTNSLLGAVSPAASSSSRRWSATTAAFTTGPAGLRSWPAKRSPTVGSAIILYLILSPACGRTCRSR